MCRYEDNGDAVNSIAVIVRSTTKNSIEEFGTPDKFLDDNKDLLGAQVFKGAQLSELYSCAIAVTSHQDRPVKRWLQGHFLRSERRLV